MKPSRFAVAIGLYPYVRTSPASLMHDRVGPTLNDARSRATGSSIITAAS
jgi:hypothetical protein